MLPTYYKHHNLLIGLYVSCSFINIFPTCLYWQDTNLATVPFTTGFLSTWSQWRSLDTTIIDKIIKKRTFDPEESLFDPFKYKNHMYWLSCAYGTVEACRRSRPHRILKNLFIFLLLQKKRNFSQECFLMIQIFSSNWHYIGLCSLTFPSTCNHLCTYTCRHFNCKKASPDIIVKNFSNRFSSSVSFFASI